MAEEDLEQRSADDDAPDSARPVTTGGRGRPERHRPKGNVGLLVGLLVVGGLLVGLVFSFQEAAVYAKTVDQVVAEKTKLAGRAVRVEGTLVKGSLTHQEQPCEYRFRIAGDAKNEIAVRYANCVVPDTFRDMPGMDVKVTVEGKLTPDGNFEATQLMAKCPSKYEMKDRQQKGEAAPHQ